MIICAREDCKAGFIPRRHNQKYCTNACCKIETNRRVMRAYYRNRDRLAGKPRFCDVCRITQLSRYNESQVCASCESKKNEDSKTSLMSMLESVSISSMV